MEINLLLLFFVFLTIIMIFKMKESGGHVTKKDIPPHKEEVEEKSKNLREPIIRDQNVPSKRNKTVIVPDCHDMAREEHLTLEDPFEEVKRIYGHGYTAYDYRTEDLTFENPISFPSKRQVDIDSSYFCLPEMEKLKKSFAHEPNPTDDENIFERDDQDYKFYQEAQPLKDVKFLVSDN